MEKRIHPPPQPSLPERAPWEEVRELCQRLDRLIELFEAWTGIAPAVPGVPGPPWPPVEAVTVKLEPAEVPTIWEAQDIVEIYKENIRDAGTFYSPRMIDFRKGKRLVIKVDSTLDQSVQITVVGNIRDSRTGIVEMGPALPCAAASEITIGLAWDDWICFVGCKIVVTTAPTAGALKIEGVVQK